MKLEIYNSWTILSKVKCMKKIDKSFIKHAETGIPQGMRAFFAINDIRTLLLAKRKITLLCNNKEFTASLLATYNDTSSPRTKMTFPKRLLSELATEEEMLFDQEVIFEKMSACCYEVSLRNTVDTQILPEKATHCQICGFVFTKVYAQEKSDNFYQIEKQQDGTQYAVCPNCAATLKINNLTPLQLKERIEEMENEDICQLLDDTKVFI